MRSSTRQVSRLTQIPPPARSASGLSCRACFTPSSSCLQSIRPFFFLKRCSRRPRRFVCLFLYPVDCCTSGHSNWSSRRRRDSLAVRGCHLQCIEIQNTRRGEDTTPSQIGGLYSPRFCTRAGKSRTCCCYSILTTPSRQSRSVRSSLLALESASGVRIPGTEGRIVFISLRRSCFGGGGRGSSRCSCRVLIARERSLTPPCPWTLCLDRTGRRSPRGTISRSRPARTLSTTSAKSPSSE